MDCGGLCRHGPIDYCPRHLHVFLKVCRRGELGGRIGGESVRASRILQEFPRVVDGEAEEVSQRIRILNIVEPLRMSELSGLGC